MQSKSLHMRGVFEILLCSALWSIAGIFMKQIPWSGFVIASLRSLIAGSVAAIYMLWRKMPFVVNKQSLFGAVTLCATMTLFSVANKMTTAANAIVLQFTSPIWVMALSAIFLKKRFHKADVIAVVVTFGGIALFFADSLRSGNLAGNLVALASGLTFGCYYMSLGDCEENVRTSSIVMANALTFLIGIPFLLTTDPVFSGSSILFIVILGVFQLGIPYVLLAHGATWCPPLVCSLLGAVEPLLNPVWVAIFDGEMPGVFALIGGVVVIATIVIWTVYKEKKEQTAQPDGNVAPCANRTVE